MSLKLTSLLVKMSLVLILMGRIIKQDVSSFAHNSDVVTKIIVLSWISSKIITVLVFGLVLHNLISEKRVITEINRDPVGLCSRSTAMTKVSIQASNIMVNYLMLSSPKFNFLQNKTIDNFSLLGVLDADFRSNCFKPMIGNWSVDSYKVSDFLYITELAKGDSGFINLDERATASIYLMSSSNMNHDPIEIPSSISSSVNRFCFIIVPLLGPYHCVSTISTSLIGSIALSFSISNIVSYFFKILLNFALSKAGDVPTQDLELSGDFIIKRAK